MGNFYSLQEAKVMMGEWVKNYSHKKPHSAFDTDHQHPNPKTLVNIGSTNDAAMIYYRKTLFGRRPKLTAVQKVKPPQPQVVGYDIF